MSLSTSGGLKLNDVPIDLILVCRIVRSCIHPIDSKDPITYEQSLCLNAVWAQIPINCGTLTKGIMKMIPHSKPVLLPFGSLIIRIVEHFGVSTVGTTLLKEKKSIDRGSFPRARVTSRKLQGSQYSHLLTQLTLLEVRHPPR